MLLNLLTETIEAARYPLSPRIQTLRRLLAKFEQTPHGAPALRPYRRQVCPVLMKPCALMVKLDRYPMRASRNTLVVGRCHAAFSVQRQLFRAGTLDGVVLISNGFLVQCLAEVGLIGAVSLFKRGSRTWSMRRSQNFV